MLKVHILTDDRVKKRGLLAEHGLSLWIEKDNKSILFDAGQSSVFCHNAKAMDISLKDADYVVISHGHYDHCGGLQYFPYEDKTLAIYAHPYSFLKKLASANKNGPFREIGIPFAISKYNWMQEQIIYTRRPLEIEKGIIVSGEIPSCSNNFEEVPKGFYVEKNGKIISDMMLDEQMLIIEDAGEIAVFLGCSHPGVINSLKYAQKLFPNKNIKLLVGGMHLHNVRPMRLHITIQHMLDMNIQKVVPLHCTGLKAMYEMKRFLGDRCLVLCAGDTIEF